MSDAARTYTHSGRVTLGRKKRRGPRLASWLVLLGLAGVTALCAYWMSRDTHPIESLIPTGRQYNVYIANVLEERHRLAESPLWETLPKNEWTPRIPKLLGRELNQPDWVLRNVLGGDVHLSGDDLDTFADLLLVTRMTPIGCLIERAYRFMPGIEHERSGGLHLRKLSDPAVYYAVRGRIFVASPSRRAIVYALTLAEDEHLTQDAVAAARLEDGPADISGSVVLNLGQPLGTYIESLGFALEADTNQAHIKGRATLRPEWQERLQGLLAHAEPKELAKPHPGRFEVSADFGIPIKDLLLELGAAFDIPALSEDQWREWEETGHEGSAASVLTALMGPLGPGIRLTWHGTDLDAMIPVPEFVATVDAGKAAVTRFAESLPPPPVATSLDELHAYYDRDSEHIHMPFMGDPGLEPTAAWYGRDLLVCSSRLLADALLSTPPKPESLEAPANLYLSLKPAACLDGLAEIGGYLAQNGLLRGHNEATFADTVAEWRVKAGQAQEITGFLGYTDRQLEGDIRLTWASAQEGD